MSKGLYRYIGETFHDRTSNAARIRRKQRMIKWRREENFTRIERPTRLDRARILGYRAKQGYVLVRGRVRRGTLRKHHLKKGHRAKRMGITRMTMGKNIQRISEERASKKYPNLEVLNSYWVGQDGHHKYFEIIMIDPHHPVIKKDPKINWICKPWQTRRTFRGLTSSGKKSRGLRHKGLGAEKARPSVRANKRRIK